MDAPKTVFCDIDGTILKHLSDVVSNYSEQPEVLKNVVNSVKEWEKLNYKIILTTGRKECVRKITEEQLLKSGIIYDYLVMGLPNGSRVLINDRKDNSPKNTAYAINLVRNSGMENISLTSKNVTISDNFLFTKIENPCGFEELVECNDKYVVKKIFMKKGNECGIQYHELKTKTIVVLSGKLNIYIGDKLENLTLKECVFGEIITVKPYTIHRVEALENSLYIESSTNELWDVIRL